MKEIVPFQLRPVLLRDAAAHLPREQNHEEGRAHGKQLRRVTDSFRVGNLTVSLNWHRFWLN